MFRLSPEELGNNEGRNEEAKAARDTVSGLPSRNMLEYAHKSYKTSSVDSTKWGEGGGGGQAIRNSINCTGMNNVSPQISF